MEKKNLFAEDSDQDESVELKTNDSYAKSYNQFRKKELLSHLKSKDLDEESSSSDDLSTDEEVVNPEFDKEFFKTLAYLKKNDPKKYEQKPKFFETTKTIETYIKEKQKKKEKPITIKDYKRELLLKHGSDFVEEDIKEEQPESENSPSYVQEQERLRQEFKNAMKNLESDDEDVLGGMLQKRDKTKEELQKEEDEYLAWLAGQKEEVAEDAKKELEPLKEFWSSNTLSKDDQFLRDYILNKRYLENETIPTYDEIIGTTLSDDEKELERQEEFEHKYNYRFEEPDKDFLKRYPRTIPDSVRAVDNKRKEKRKERQERKEQEKLLKKRDLDELNKLRKQEIEEKLQRLKEIAQNEKFNLNEDELESEFDPEEHDRRMREAFNDEYYMINEGEQKPEFPELDQELDIEDWDNFNAKNEGADTQEMIPHCEDDDFIMDCDYDPVQAKLEKSKQLQDELIESTKSKKKKRKRMSKLAEIIKSEKPVYEPSDDKTFEEYLDEYYKLDYEDIIGDTPCRFKYVETTPNDFGLTIEEILMASNKELNQWASFKKTMQNRSVQEEMSDYYKFQKRAKNEMLKRKIFKSIYGEQEDEKLDEDIQKEVEPTIEKLEQEPINKEPKKKKRKQMKLKSAEVVDVKNIVPHTEKASLPENNTELGAEKTQQKPKKEKLLKKSPAKEQPGRHVKIVKGPNGNDNTKRKPFNKDVKGPIKHKKQFHKDGKTTFGSKTNDAPDISESRLRAFGINPKRFYNKIKYGPNSQANKSKGLKNNFKIKKQNGKKIATKK